MITHRSYSLFTLTFSLVFAAALSGVAKTFDWPIDAPTAIARQFTAYHGETIRFNLRLGGAMTNLAPVCLYYQTNGMGKAEWFGPVPGTVFHPTNDCGAASYRFFVLCNDPDGKDYTANGSLRLLDSPGFAPSAVQLPVQSLDFATIEVLNPPWGEGPGNYAAVSNAAMNAAQNATNLVAAATNGIPRITESAAYEGWAANAERAEMAGEAELSTDAQYADEAEYAWTLSDGDDMRDASAIFSQLDAATATNAAQQAALAGKASTNDVALTPVYGGSGDRFGDWVVDNSEVYVVWNVYNSCWYFVKYDTSEMPFAFQANAPNCYDVNATSIAYHDEIDVTATRTENPIIGYTLGAQTNKVIASTNGVLRTESDPTVPAWAKSAQKPKYTSSEVGAYPNASGEQLSAQVSAIGTYLNAEDARFVSTNYDSVVRTPEAYVEVRLTDNGTNVWTTIWREMTRWCKFVGNAFDWNTWVGFHAWATNVTAELSHKADRCWGIYDSETGGYSPEGYTQISSSNILIAAGMAYQRTVTTSGNVWVLQCNQGTAHIGGDTNGFFRVVDGDGVTQFEIIKGDRREMGADASGITVSAGNVMTIPYSVEAAEHPTIRCCNNLATADWKDETDADCLCTVSWSGSSGAWVATVTPKTAQPSMFVKATFMAGGETYIRNVAPVGMDSIMLNGTKYYLGTATISGHTVLTLSTSPIVQ